MLSTITGVQREASELIQQRRDDYLRTLVAPMDGMWKGVFIDQAAFWEIQDRGQYAGYFCIGSDHELLRVYLLEDYQERAQEIFGWIISTYGIQYAIASTIEPLYLSLCLDLQKSVAVHGYLFRDHQRRELSAELGAILFRRAETEDLQSIIDFYQANTEGWGAGLEEFLHRRIDLQELFVFYDRETVVASGECIPSLKQPPYVDLGMVVARAYRGRGLGSSMLIHMKRYCYEKEWKPICGCDADNLASKRAIEKAGFVSEHRIVKVQFS